MWLIIYKLYLFRTLLILFVSINIGYPQPRIIVIGNEFEIEIEQMVEFYSAILKLDQEISIVINYGSGLPDDVSGFTLFKAYSVKSPIMQVYIKIDSTQSKKIQLLTLAHEMIHVKQFVNGELVHCGDDVYSWFGKIYNHIKYIPYTKRQWEQEALKKQYILFRKFVREKRNLTEAPMTKINPEKS